MEYEDEVATDNSQAVDTAELESFLKNLVAPPAKQLTAQEKVDIRRKVEDILNEKDYHQRYGDPFSE